MKNYLSNQDTLLLKDFLSKSELKTFFNERLYTGKVKKINCRTKSAVIFTVQNSNKEMNFTPSLTRVQSVDFRKNEITFTISQKEYKYLMNEVHFWRTYPEKAAKRKLTVI